MCLQQPYLNFNTSFYNYNPMYSNFDDASTFEVILLMMPKTFLKIRRQVSCFLALNFHFHLRALVNIDSLVSYVSHVLIIALKPLIFYLCKEKSPK